MEIEQLIFISIIVYKVKEVKRIGEKMSFMLYLSLSFVALIGEY